VRRTGGSRAAPKRKRAENANKGGREEGIEDSVSAHERPSTIDDAPAAIATRIDRYLVVTNSLAARLELLQPGLALARVELDYCCYLSG